MEERQGWAGPAVELYAGAGVPWRGVSRRLVTARGLVVSAVAVAALAGLVLLAALTGSGLPLWGCGAVLVGWLLALVVVRRQVGAISWAEQPEELVIRRGRLWRTLVSVPYGRLQFADMQSGPLARRLGIARVEVHTGAVHTHAHIPGLPVEEAEALRSRLIERGESQRAGL